MHWMSAVMAEHINHHAVDGVHYVWNGAVEVRHSPSLLLLSLYIIRLRDNH